ncbi:ABC transporter substrate-binding protein [Halohasta litorea]|uniref:ABC transporter substrate-binding protein n=1 Tax=Halohasta litorea TaxID=869891 RepID=A0ABD6DB78_9EURY|nr:ABC transporter substrate-binding protein [Halohasta litorea]
MAAESVTRRRFLATTAGALVTTSGCVGGVQNLAGRSRTAQLSLRISTVPASEDPYAVWIANHLADNLEASGVDTIVDPMSYDVFLREVLINHEFDIYIGRYPRLRDPDELRSMLYSAYSEEQGWQNPFGFSDPGTDELLDEQRAVSGDDRIDITNEIQQQILNEQPFVVLGVADRISAVRTDRFSGWPDGGLDNPTDYLLLDRAGEETTLELLLQNGRITENRNPLAVEYRDRGTLVGLLYEPLVRTPDGVDEPLPWLARDIAWEESEPTAATVRLRETPWHDGRSVTADDVAFTYEFLADTSLGEYDTAVPTPWRRSHVSLVESVTVEANDRLRIEFTTPNRSLAYRGLSVPILPEHIWRERSDAADLAGVDLSSRTTSALVDPNEAAVGSGFLQFDAAVPKESVSLTVFPEHFLWNGDANGIPARFGGTQPFDRVEFTVVPSQDAAVEVLAEGDADAPADRLQASIVPRIIDTEGISMTRRVPSSFYHVGCNCRRAPLTDPRFRQVLAQHLDRSAIVDEAFDGHGTPSEVPLRGKWVPKELEWNGTASRPFLGSDGDVAVERTQDAFRSAGYQYDGDQLVRRSGQ